MMVSYQKFVDASNGLVYLATAVKQKPSVRLVAFAVDANDESVWYVFSMDPHAPKTEELAQNEHVAVVTSVDMKSGMRINSNQVTMVPSQKTWDDVQPFFADNQGFLNAHHPEQEKLYELHFDSLVLETYNPADRQEITFHN